MREAERLVCSAGRNIERISEDVKRLSDGLKLEAEARKNISKELGSKIAAFKGALWLATALGAAAVAIFIGWLTGLVKAQ